MPAAPPSWAGRAPGRGRQPRPRSVHGDEPAGGLVPEGRRHGLLKQRPGGHRRIPMPARKAAAECLHGGQFLVDHAQRPPRNQHGRAVDDVLARGAEVDVLRGVAVYPAAQRPHERLDRSARGTSLFDQAGCVDRAPGVGRHDELCRVRGNHARAGLGAGEGGLDLDHRADPGRIRDGVAQWGRDEDRLEGRQWSKNTVCRSPCIRMSKRRPPSSCSATSVARSASSRLASSGSAAFASGSSGK